MNLNKEYLITVDIKNATVTAPGNMSFYITDIKTANIFAQLVFNESNSTLITRYAPVENAQDFEITLRIIKPNNEFKELKFTLLNQLEAFFMVDLTDEYKDYIGTYYCELFVDCVVNGELERITTSSFNYKVNKSIVNNLDDVIDNDPDYPLLDEILDRLEGIDTNGYVTVADIPDMIDSYFTGYHDNIALSAPFKITKKANIPLDARTVVDTESDIMNIEYPYVGMIIYVRDTGKRYEVLTLAPKQVGFATVQDAGVGTYRELDYATTTYVDEAVANAGGNVDLSGYAPIISPEFDRSISMGRAADSEVGDYSTALGYMVTASGKGSHAEGYLTTASGYISHAEGSETHATGENSHAEGFNTTASEMNSHAEGQSTTASGGCSHAEGHSTRAIGPFSHAEGMGTTANGMGSHAEGNWTIASGQYQHVQGKYNIEDTANTYAHIVGNGTNPNARVNIHTLGWNGIAWFAGDVFVGGDSTFTGYRLATEYYVEDKIGDIDSALSAILGGENNE